MVHKDLMEMVADFKKYPQQYKVNIKTLKVANDDFLTGVDLLEKMYNED